MLEFWNDGFPKMHTVLPDGVEQGNVNIKHVTPTKQDADFAHLRSMIAGNGMGRGAVQAGETLCQLFGGNTLWMSDTPDERRDHRYVSRHLKGHVLIGGLGMGMFALFAALRPEVEKVTVIEINPDIIDLVLPHLHKAMKSQGINPDKLVVIEDDLLAWKPPKGEKYQCIWFDIWANLCTDNLEDMATLNRRFARRTDGYRECWGESLLKVQRERERRRGWW